MNKLQQETKYCKSLNEMTEQEFRNHMNENAPIVPTGSNIHEHFRNILNSASPLISGTEIINISSVITAKLKPKLILNGKNK